MSKNIVEVIKSYTYLKGVRDVLMKEGVYHVCLRGYKSAISESSTLLNLLVVTGDSCQYVRELLTDKQIPVCISERYFYKELGKMPEEKKKRIKNHLVGPYKFPYYVDFDVNFVKKEDVIEEHYDLFGFYCPSEKQTLFEYEYGCGWYPITENSRTLSDYLTQHQDREKFSLELDKLFSKCIDECIYEKWPWANEYKDIYCAQREADKEKMMRKMKKFENTAK